MTFFDFPRRAPDDERTPSLVLGTRLWKVHTKCLSFPNKILISAEFYTLYS